MIDPALLRVRTFRWALVAMFLFNVSFAANLLVGVLWLQQVWGYGVLRTGLAVAVGPLLVPATAALVQRLVPTAVPSRLVMAGSVVCAVGCAVAALRMGESPAYLSDYLPAWAIGGVGVGLALPNLMAGSTHDLPSTMAATGSGVVTMARQIGFVVGVSILFALVGDGVGVAARRRVPDDVAGGGRGAAARGVRRGRDAHARRSGPDRGGDDALTGGG